MPIEIKLCNKIERLPIYSAMKDENGNIVPKNGKSWIPVPEAQGTFSEESKYSNAGASWFQKLDISCELSRQEVMDIALVPHIYRLYFSNGISGIFGSIENPIVEPKIKGIVTQKQISFERSAKSSEF